jgi:hypothetical protein
LLSNLRAGTGGTLLHAGRKDTTYRPAAKPSIGRTVFARLPQAHFAPRLALVNGRSGA